jgi:ethanolamine utilization protein EutN
MKLGKVIGNVVSTVKTGKIHGLPLLVVQPLDENLKSTLKAVACTDTVNAKHGEIVLICSSSSSRFTRKTKGTCTDFSIVAIVDLISSGKQDIYVKHM